MACRQTRSRRCSDRAAAGGRRLPSIRKQNEAQLDRKRPQERRNFCSIARYSARARIQRGYAQTAAVRKHAHKAAASADALPCPACKLHQDSVRRQDPTRPPSGVKLAAVIVEAGDDPQRVRPPWCTVQRALLGRGGLCLNASLGLSVFGLSRFLCSSVFLLRCPRVRFFFESAA